MANRGGKRRNPARERVWRRAIRRQEQSGLDVPEFCRFEDLKDGTFRWWGQEPAGRDQQPASAATDESQGQPTEAALAFLSVRVVDLGSVAPRPPASVKIVLPDGPTIRGAQGFDSPTLDAVLLILEARRW